MDIPCKDCICLPVCVSMVSKFTTSSDLLNIEFINRCPELKKFYNIEYDIPPNTPTRKYYSKIEFVRDGNALLKKIDMLFKYLRHPFDE